MFGELLDTIENAVNEQLDKMDIIRAADIGWDTRGAYEFHASEDGIAIANHLLGSALYYNGLEYVDQSNRFTAGDYTFFSVEANRILELITMLKDRGMLGGHEETDPDEEDEE